MWTVFFGGHWAAAGAAKGMLRSTARPNAVFDRMIARKLGTAETQQYRTRLLKTALHLS